MPHPSFAPGYDDAQDLIELRSGSADIAVGISGFGSAEVPVERWMSLYETTGRTTFVLRYDAQTLPSPFFVQEMRRRWTLARSAGLLASVYLAGWVNRWLSSGRRVVLVGFSLGGFIAWETAKRIAAESPRADRLDVILISAAIGDTPGQWEAAQKIGSLVNLYARRDEVLRTLYPMGVGTDETPAAGLGPLILEAPNIYNVDVVDLVGWKHTLDRPEQIPRLAKVGMGCLLGLVDCDLPWYSLEGSSMPPPRISELQAQRLLAWLVADTDLWRIYGLALEGDDRAMYVCAWADGWSLARPGRLRALIDAGTASVALVGRRWNLEVAARSRFEIQGMLRAWMWRDGGVKVEEIMPLRAEGVLGVEEAVGVEGE